MPYFTNPIGVQRLLVTNTWNVQNLIHRNSLEHRQTVTILPRVTLTARKYGKCENVNLPSSLENKVGETKNVAGTARKTHARFKIPTPSCSTRQLLTEKSIIFSRESINFTFRKFSRKMSGPSSPTHTDAGHHRSDDISALSEGFEKIYLNRRRLSTVSDLTTCFEKEGESSSSGDSRGGSSAKGRQLNWLDGQKRISESSEGDDDCHSPKVISPENTNASKSKHDIFTLLERVIEFRGRNVSHITVEQSVKELCTVYNETVDEVKHSFFINLAENYGVDQELVTTLANSLLSAEDEHVRLSIQEKLRAALVPKYHWLFSQIGRLENGVKFLVDFRTDLQETLEKPLVGSSHVKALNVCLRDLIGMWFAVGFLNLERVTWQSSCDMLQKISEYEAVHPMRNWTDLKRRVGPYRRCFVFTHGSMPQEPVVVLHTALTDHIPSCIRKIVSNQRMMSLDSDADLTATGQKEDASFVDTAIFYSITSTQRGLMGIELGNYLIKRVVRELQSEFPKMSQFSSLSPIPGFKTWLTSELKAALKNSNSQKLFTPHELEILSSALEVDPQDVVSIVTAFQESLKLNDWYSKERLVKDYENLLMRLCGQYLCLVKRRGYAIDSVANFHLKNGAVIWRLNWLGDNSPRGLGQSCGIMVNYRYFLEECEKNSQNYMEKQTIEISDQVRHLVKLTQCEMTSKI